MAAIEHGLLIGGSPNTWVFNGQYLEDCEGLILLDVLNYLGQDEWEFAGTLDRNQFILKRK